MEREETDSEIWDSSAGGTGDPRQMEVRGGSSNLDETMFLQRLGAKSGARRWRGRLVPRTNHHTANNGVELKVSGINFGLLFQKSTSHIWHKNTPTFPVVHLTDREISSEASFHFLPAQHAGILQCNCKCCLNIEVYISHAQNGPNLSLLEALFSLFPVRGGGVLFINTA